MAPPRLVATLVAALGASICLFCTAQPQPLLRFSSEGKYTISMLTDLHLGEQQSTDTSTFSAMQTVLDTEQPDLVVLGGDQVSGFAYPAADLPARLSRLLGGAPSWYEQQWRRLVAPLQAAGVPYAAILGNHDGEADLGRRQIAEMDAATGRGLSLTQPGPSHITGAGNYWLDVLEPGQGTAVAARIWMLDSGNRGCGAQAQGWGCVAPDTVAWVRQQAARLPRVPSLAFVHIPLPQMAAAWNSGAAVNGSKGELVGCPGADSGFFAAAREFGIGAVYSGHDHHNDFSGSLEGVRLAYGRKSGHGSYGPSGLLRGSRIVELRLGEDPADSATWIRQEDGSKVFLAAAEQPRQLWQEACSLDVSGCDRWLGPQACVSLRGARNSLALAGVLSALLAAAAVTAAAAVVLARRTKQLWRYQQGWENVPVADKKDMLV